MTMMRALPMGIVLGALLLEGTPAAEGRLSASRVAEAGPDYGVQGEYIGSLQVGEDADRPPGGGFRVRQRQRAAGGEQAADECA